MPAAIRSSLALEQRAAAQALEALASGHRLDTALGRVCKALGLEPGSSAAVRDMASFAARQLGLCQALSRLLSEREPALAVAALQWLALSQLLMPQRRAATIVDQAVHAARADARTANAAGFLNATLRAFLRDPERLLARAREEPEARWNHPRWWIDVLRAERGTAWQSVLEVSNAHPPLTLRINRQRTNVAAYIAQLDRIGLSGRQVGESAVIVEPPCPVETLPGWASGLVSVQDEGAQRAAQWLDLAPGQRVLDACAAPGGKSAHILELAPVQLTAVELEPQRLDRMAQGLARLSLSAQLVCGDAGEPNRWWDRVPFDRVVVDAPCSASGIVRRAPDARWLRRRSDLATFARSQRRLLDRLWPLVAQGGKLLYVTCSVFDAEGSDVARRFLQDHPDASALALPGSSASGPGVQLLPISSAQEDHDGFYYCLIGKRG